MRADGSQYCVWHPDSVRLAVSSDLLRAVFVMDAVQRMTLMRFEDLRRPCMALAFPPAPSLAQTPILVFAENARNIYIAGRVASCHPSATWAASCPVVSANVGCTICTTCRPSFVCQQTLQHRQCLLHSGQVQAWFTASPILHRSAEGGCRCLAAYQLRHGGH